MNKPIRFGIWIFLAAVHAHNSLAEPTETITDVVTYEVPKNRGSGTGQAPKERSGRDYQFLSEAVVLSGSNVSLGESLGPYRVVTDPKSLSLKGTTTAFSKSALNNTNIVVRVSKTGQLGLADGELIIEPKFTSDREIILQQYGLKSISVAPSETFFTARVSDISDLPSVFAALLTSPLVKEADLSVNYFDQVPH